MPQSILPFTSMELGEIATTAKDTSFIVDKAPVGDLSALLHRVNTRVKFHRWKRWLGLYGWKPCKPRSHYSGFTRHCAPRSNPGFLFKNRWKLNTITSKR